MEVEKKLGKYIKAIRFDRDGEYFLGEFNDYLLEAEIIFQLTTSGTP